MHTHEHAYSRNYILFSVCLLARLLISRKPAPIPALQIFVRMFTYCAMEAWQQHCFFFILFFIIIKTTVVSPTSTSVFLKFSIDNRDCMLLLYKKCLNNNFEEKYWKMQLKNNKKFKKMMILGNTGRGVARGGGVAKRNGLKKAGRKREGKSSCIVIFNIPDYFKYIFRSDVHINH